MLSLTLKATATPMKGGAMVQGQDYSVPSKCVVPRTQRASIQRRVNSVSRRLSLLRSYYSTPHVVTTILHCNLCSCTKRPAFSVNRVQTVAPSPNPLRRAPRRTPPWGLCVSGMLRNVCRSNTAGRVLTCSPGQEGMHHKPNQTCSYQWEGHWTFACPSPWSLIQPGMKSRTPPGTAPTP